MIATYNKVFDKHLSMAIIKEFISVEISYIKSIIDTNTAMFKYFCSYWISLPTLRQK